MCNHETLPLNEQPACLRSSEVICPTTPQAHQCAHAEESKHLRVWQLPRLRSQGYRPVTMKGAGSQRMDHIMRQRMLHTQPSHVP